MVGNKFVEECALSLEVEKVRPGNIVVAQGTFAFVVALRHGGSKGQHSFLVGYGRKGPEQDPFNPTEDSGVSADSQCEAKNRKKRKAGIAAQHAESKAEILKKTFDE